jgi:mono/diheme cytochrome c family protein
MKSWLRLTLGVVAFLVVCVLALAAAGLLVADRRMARRLDTPPRPVAFVTDAQSLERGKYLYESRGCADCHGTNGGGRMFVDKGKGSLRIAGPNITPGGVTGRYKAEDWERSIRHGVNPDGRPLIVMPSEDYNRFTDADLAALVAHIRALPPQSGGAAIVEFPPPVRILYGFGAIQDAAAKINHQLPPQQPVPVGVSAQHGAYVANMCIGCHGEGLSGGKVPGGPPDWPPAANITPGEGSAMARYPDAAAFTTMLRSGKRPDGTAIKVMPFDSLGKLNDVDTHALYAYLKTVPARAAGTR